MRNKGKQVVLWLMIMLLVIPPIHTKTVSAEKKATSNEHILLADEREFHGNADDIVDVSDKHAILQSDNVHFSTTLKTDSNGFMSLFYIGPKTDDTDKALNNYITMYMNGGNRIGVEMKGIEGGYVHFYYDLAENYNDNEWHDIGLEMIEGTQTKIIVDGEAYDPVFASNSTGMPDGAQTKFVPDATFATEEFNIGGAKRADKRDWLFNGSMKNVFFATDVDENGNPTAFIDEQNMNLMDKGAGEDISAHIEALQAMEKGTVTMRFRNEADHKEDLQYLFSLGEKDKEHYVGLYMQGETIGFERIEDGQTIVQEETSLAPFSHDTKWYSVSLVNDGKDTNIYVDDEKVLTFENESFLSLEDANYALIGDNGSLADDLALKGYVDAFQVYNVAMKEKAIIDTVHAATKGGKVEVTEVDRPLPDPADAFRSDDEKMFASVSKDMVFNESLVGDPDIMGEDGFGFRIPALLNVETDDKDVLIAFADKGNDSADWGNVHIANRQSFDNGETWTNVNDMVRLPTRDAPQEFHDWGSAFYIDPLPVQDANGDIVVMVDMFPESKGLHAPWLENGTGYTNIDGNDYLVLYDGESKVGDNPNAASGKEYTVREEGWIYDEDGERTNYYIPQHHDEAYLYETMGDMYYAVGDADYIDEAPPFIPENPEGSADVYVGNIYLNYDKPAFDPENPVFVEKTEVGSDKDGDAYSKYKDYVTEAAPLRTAVTSYLWVTKSSDNGQTWSQPFDITPQVKRDSDGSFLGVGPGVGITLEHQTDQSKNGRIVMPVYALGKGAALYSDDGGITWERGTSDSEGYINNIDEMQFIEQADGTIMSVGRQTGKGATPVSYSKDGGETWSERTTTDLTSVAVQKSMITYPLDTEQGADEAFAYVDGMEAGKQYVIAAHATDNSNQWGRSKGAITLGEVQADNTITWIAQRSLALDPNPYADTGGAEDFFAYSSLAVLENGEIGVLFESQPNNYIAYASFNLEWILNGDADGEIFEPTIVTETPSEIKDPILEDITFDTVEQADGQTHLTYTLSFDEYVFVNGEATLNFTLDGETYEASYVEGSGTKEVSFAYDLQTALTDDMEVIVQTDVQVNGLFEGVYNGAIDNTLPKEVQLQPDNKTTLKALIEKAKAAAESDAYTEDSRQALFDALSSAEAVLADEGASIYDVQGAIEALQAAMDGLEEKEEAGPSVDTAALEQALEAAKAISNDDESYTAESFANMQDAIAQAEKALEAEIQAEVDEALKNLQAAMDGLKEEESKEDDESGEDGKEEEEPKPEEKPETPSTGDLEALVKEAEKVAKEKDIYTTASLKQLQAALQVAERALASESQSQIDQALEALQAALDGLEKEPSTSIVEEDTNEETGEAGSALPKTATNIFNLLLLGVMLLGIGVFVWKRRKLS